MKVDFAQFFLFFILSFAIILLFVFLYTQTVVDKKRITVTNSKNEKINVIVEIASDPLKRAAGLMFRQELGENEGMLFIFDRPGLYGFWMVNTTMPLDAVFFDENKKVVDIIRMEPCKQIAEQCRVYLPKKPAKYALEVNRGFAERNSIKENCSFDFS
jgi:uncharacterized membrane protein (UPF0127 family)